MNINWLKKVVIKRRCNWDPKLANKLAEGIEVYEKSKITNDQLIKYYTQLKAMAKKQ